MVLISILNPNSCFISPGKIVCFQVTKRINPSKYLDLPYLYVLHKFDTLVLIQLLNVEISILQGFILLK